MTELADLADIPEDAIGWAAIAWAAGCAEGYTVGYRRAEDEMAQQWAAAVRPVRDVLRMPDQDELRRRRGHGEVAA